MIFRAPKFKQPTPFDGTTARLIHRLYDLNYVKKEEDETAKITLLQVSLQLAFAAYSRRSFLLIRRQDKRRLAAIIANCERITNQYGYSSTALRQIQSQVGVFIAELESRLFSPFLLKDLHESGVLSCVYEEPTLPIITDYGLQRLVNKSYWNFLIALCGVLFYTVLACLNPPFFLQVIANGALAGGVVVINGFSGGLYESQSSAKYALPSLILGVNYHRYSMMRSNDKSAQLSAWAAIKARERSYHMAFVFAITSTILSVFFPFNPWTLTVLLMATPIASWVTERVLSLHRHHPEQLTNRLNDYQRQGVEAMHLCDEEKKAWLANIDRDKLHWRKSFGLHALALPLLVVSCVLSSHMPVFCFTFFLNAVVPATIVLTVALLVVISAVYLKRHQDVVHHNRFALDLQPKKSIEDSLPKEEYEKEQHYGMHWLYQRKYNISKMPGELAPEPIMERPAHSFQ